MATKEPTIDLALEVAARSPMERYRESASTTIYRFDTRHSVGDYTLVEVMTPFAGEMTARQALYEILTQYQ